VRLTQSGDNSGRGFLWQSPVRGLADEGSVGSLVVAMVLLFSELVVDHAGVVDHDPAENLGDASASMRWERFTSVFRRGVAGRM
jgi:hypothetical protein